MDATFRMDHFEGNPRGRKMDQSFGVRFGILPLGAPLWETLGLFLGAPTTFQIRPAIFDFELYFENRPALPTRPYFELLKTGRPIHKFSNPAGSANKAPETFQIRPAIFDFEPDVGLLGQTRPEISGTIPTNRNTTIPNDSGLISACFDDDPKLLNCEIAQPSPVMLH